MRPPAVEAAKHSLREGGHLGVDLAGDDPAAVADRLGHRQRRVPGEHPDLEDRAGAGGVHERREQPALDVPGEHLLLEAGVPGVVAPVVPGGPAGELGERGRRRRGAPLEVRVEAGGEVPCGAQPVEPLGVEGTPLRPREDVVEGRGEDADGGDRSGCPGRGDRASGRGRRRRRAGGAHDAATSSGTTNMSSPSPPRG